MVMVQIPEELIDAIKSGYRFYDEYGNYWYYDKIKRMFSFCHCIDPENDIWEDNYYKEEDLK